MTVFIGHVDGRTGFPGFKVAPELGVVLFFALSGFLLGHLYLHQQPTARSIVEYVLARFARVYPLFAVVVVSAIALSAILPIASPFRFKPDDLLPHLLFFGDGKTVWTISVEFQFYAAFVLLWLLYAALPRNKDAIFFILATGVIAFCWWRGFPDGRIAFFGYFHLFLLGVMGAVVWRHFPSQVELGGRWLLPGLIALYVAMFLALPQFYNPRSAFYDLFVCLASVSLVVAAAAASPSSWASRALSTKPMVLLGEISFGIYLLHRPLVQAWESTGVPLAGVALFMVLIISTVAAAGFTYVLIERPSRAYIRSFANARLVRMLPARSSDLVRYERGPAEAKPYPSSTDAN